MLAPGPLLFTDDTLKAADTFIVGIDARRGTGGVVGDCQFAASWGHLATFLAGSWGHPVAA
jgi:hypothetical protein